MKKKSAPFKLGMFKFLLFVPLLLLSFCQSEMEEPTLDSGSEPIKDAKVLLLMKSAIVSDSDIGLAENKTSLLKTAETAQADDQCTYFLYPMTFEVYSGDNPNPVLWEINSDEELISFVDTLVAAAETYKYYIRFPITLLDSEGGETVLDDLDALTGTLQMAVEACESLNNNTTAGDDGSEFLPATTPTVSNGTDGSSNDGSGSGSGSGSDDGSGDGTGGGLDDGSGDDSDDGTESGGDDGSDDGSSIYTAENTDDNEQDYEYCDKNSKKVKICHKGIPICVSVNAIWGHMQHHEEDYLGDCVD